MLEAPSNPYNAHIGSVQGRIVPLLILCVRSFLELYEEVKRISQVNSQPKRDQAVGKRYEEEELSDDDEYLCEYG